MLQGSCCAGVAIESIPTDDVYGGGAIFPFRNPIHAIPEVRPPRWRSRVVDNYYVHPNILAALSPPTGVSKPVQRAGGRLDEQENPDRFSVESMVNCASCRRPAKQLKEAISPTAAHERHIHTRRLAPFGRGFDGRQGRK